ncbi:glycosyl hydrolase [Leucosporidium creatinivorum]|uniref:Glycosyl hydrolase n=1 Tax=Leucosporidium creatinivorum TaxID=106004 RepID=A0A1Y2F7W4_9BASI|nr:glycosyl hydrolase [Leucosporidium creatinivorum]
MSTYRNPIIPGFSPDPTCIQVKGIYYLLTSSFLSFPGIPIYTSTDLTHWTHVNNVVQRREQLPRLNETGVRFPIGGGLWAPSLRYRETEDMWYVTVTLVFPQTEYGAKERWENLLFKTRDPLGDWGLPIKFSFPGYDTSLSWDGEGRAWVQGAHYWRVRPEILSLPLDLSTGKALGEPIKIWSGLGGKAPEAPHVWEKDGWWWVIIAEGGTESGHSSTMARSRSPTSPPSDWEVHPSNPVLTSHPSSTPSPDPTHFTTIGHADLFQSPDGRWWAVALATRDGRDERAPMGRETVLVPVEWEEGGWPTFGKVEGEMKVELPASEGAEVETREGVIGVPILEERGKEDLLALCAASHAAAEGSRSNSAQLSWPLHLLFLRLPNLVDYTLSTSSTTNRPHLLLNPSPTSLAHHPLAPFTDGDLQLPSSRANSNLTSSSAGSIPEEYWGTSTFLSRRQTDLEGVMTASFALPLGGGEEEGLRVEAGLAVFLDETHHFLFGLSNNSSAESSEAGAASQQKAEGPAVFFRSTAEGAQDVSAPLPPTSAASSPSSQVEILVNLRIEWKMTSYTFSYRPSSPTAAEDGGWIQLGTGDSKDVSGGFTGVLLGVYASREEGGGQRVGETGRVKVMEWEYESRRRW